MVRCVNNFLNEDERELVSSFIASSIKRFYTMDNRTGGLPPRLDTSRLEELYKRKYLDWDNRVRKSMIPHSSKPFYSLVVETEGKVCSIEWFLNSLKIIMEQKNFPYEYEDIIQVLDSKLRNCGFPCPCPADIENN